MGNAVPCRNAKVGRIQNPHLLFKINAFAKIARPFPRERP